MNISSMNTSPSSTNFTYVAPVSISIAVVAVIIASFILILISSTKQLHTVTHLLVCNTCVSSILYCFAQCNNYIYLLIITWDTSDISCQWRGYFSYMSIVAVIYSYLLQAISRLIFAFWASKHRGWVSFKVHIILIIIKWIIVLVLPLPSLLTKDIYFREGFLCWVPKTRMIHVAYTVFTYYFFPILSIVGLYILIYIRIHRSTSMVVGHERNQAKSMRDLNVLRNIMILFGIYILGAVPSILYILSGVEIFYSIGIVSVSLTVATEKFTTIFLDREIRNSSKKYFCRRRRTTAVLPFTVNHTIAFLK